MILKELIETSTDLIRVKSTARAERNADRLATDEELDTLANANLRYEPDTNMLYIKSPVARELKSSSYYAPLFNSQCYIGSFSFAFYRGTPYKGTSCHCHAFDLSKSEEPKATMLNPPDYLYRKQASKLRKQYPGDPSRVAELMVIWVEDYAKKMQKTTEPTKTIPESKRREQLLLNRIRRLEEKLLGRKPKEKAPRTILEEIDAYIAQNSQHIRKTVIRLALNPETKRPEIITKSYDPKDRDLPTLGRYEDINKTGHRKQKLALQVAALKQVVPHFKQDKRYTHSQKVRIANVSGSDQDWCAVFDLTRK